MNKSIVFDIDGVLSDFIKGFTMRGAVMFGTPITTTAEQPSWDGFPGMTSEQIKAVWNEIKVSPSFWYRLEPLVSSETFRRINELSEHHLVYFVTNRVGPNVKRQTEMWLRAMDIQNPTVIISADKGEACRLVKATHAIDDKAGNAVCIQYMSPAQSYIIDRPYNRFPHETIGTKVIRVNAIEEFLNDVEEDSRVAVARGC